MIDSILAAPSLAGEIVSPSRVDNRARATRSNEIITATGVGASSCERMHVVKSPDDGLRPGDATKEKAIIEELFEVV